MHRIWSEFEFVCIMEKQWLIRHLSAIETWNSIFCEKATLDSLGGLVGNLYSKLWLSCPDPGVLNILLPVRAKPEYGSCHLQTGTVVHHYSVSSSNPKRAEKDGKIPNASRERTNQKGHHLPDHYLLYLFCLLSSWHCCEHTDSHV